MIYNNIDGEGQTFEIVVSNFESLKNSQKFLIISAIIQLYKSKSLEVKDDKINFIIFIYNRKNSYKSIVGNIHLYNKLSIEDIVCKDRSGDKCIL